MTSQKRDRLVAAVTVNVVLLLVILVAVMVYQLVTIFVLKDDETNYQEEISQITEIRENMEYDIKYYQTDQGLMDLIMKYGLYKN